MENPTIYTIGKWYYDIHMKMFVKVVDIQIKGDPEYFMRERGSPHIKVEDILRGWWYYDLDGTNHYPTTQSENGIRSLWDAETSILIYHRSMKDSDVPEELKLFFHLVEYRYLKDYKRYKDLASDIYTLKVAFCIASIIMGIITYNFH